MNEQLISLRSLFVGSGAINLAVAALGTMVALQIAATGGTQQTVSLAAAAYSLGFLIGCFRIGGYLARIGYIRAFAAAAAICTICTLVLSLTNSPVGIIASRFVLGIATAGLYAIGDAWINATAAPETRGRTLAIYAIVFGLTAAASQFLVAGLTDDLARGFVVVAMLFCVAAMVLATTRTSPPDGSSSADVRLKETFEVAPLSFVGAFVNGAVVTILLNVLPYRLASLGLTATAVSFAVAAIYFGRVFLQYPIGRASDNMDRRVVIMVVSAVSAVILAIIAALAHGDGSAISGLRGWGEQAASYIVLVLLGGTLMPAYSLLVAHASDRTVPVYVASSAVTLLFVYTLGGVIGPLVAAGVTTAFGPSVMAWGVSFMMLGLAIFAAISVRRDDPVAKAEMAEHVPAPTTSVTMMPESKKPNHPEN